MQVGLAQCVNKGMQRDYSMDKASQEFAYENKNIRITTNGDNSFLSVSNEKSTIPFVRKFNQIIPTLDGWFKADYAVASDVKVVVVSDEIVEETPDGPIYKEYEVVIKKGNLTADNIYNFGLLENTKHMISLYISEETRSDDVYYYLSFNEYPDSDVLIKYEIKGTIIGTVTLENYLIVFSHSDSNDYIYRFKLDDLNIESFMLYEGDLEFDLEHPIECITSYEGSDIQKVYWVDGKNQPRVINIAVEDKYLEGVSFDFVPDISSSSLDVNVKKEYNGTGNFTSGVIQYYITYYNKFGSETKVVHQTPLYYISPSDRGGKVDERQTCNFVLDIKPKNELNFDYIRVYSLVRTSLNTGTIVRVVGDIKLNGTNEIRLVDTNNGTYVEDTSLLFKGGNSIVASTIEQKDNTLFLGNITEVASFDDLSGLKDVINGKRTESSGLYAGDINMHLPKDILSFKWKVLGFNTNDINSQYSYYNQLNNSSKDIKGFKHREIYRFGLQFQTKEGEWSSTIFLDDAICDKYPKVVDSSDVFFLPADSGLELNKEEYYFLDEDGTIKDVYNTYMCLPYVHFNPDNIFSSLDKKYVKYRLLMVESTIEDRSIVCQGYVNPTLWNPLTEHCNSWITRPMNDQMGTTYNKHLENVLNTQDDKPTPNTELDLALYAEDSIYLSALLDKNNIEDVWNLHTITLSYYYIVENDVGRFRGITKYKFLLKHPNFDDVVVETTNYNKTSSSTRIKAYKLAKESNDILKYSEEMLKQDSVIGGEIYEGDTTYNLLIQAISNVDSSFNEDTGIENVENDSYILEKGEFFILSDSSAKKAEESKKKIKTLNRIYITDQLTSNKIERRNHYFVDASLCSFNTPNFEEVKNIVNNSNLKFRIVGKSDLTNNISSYVLTSDNSGNREYNFDFNFNGSYNTDLRLQGLKSYPMWKSSESNSNDTTSFVYLWNTNSLSKGDSPIEIHNIQQKVFANMWYGKNTEYHIDVQTVVGGGDESLEKPIIWIPDDDLEFIKESIDSKINLRGKIYNKDLEDVLIPNAGTNPWYFTDFPYSDNPSYNYKEAENNILVNRSLGSVNIGYNSSNHFVFKLSQSESVGYTVLPGYSDGYFNMQVVNGFNRITNKINIINNDIYPKNIKTLSNTNIGGLYNYHIFQTINAEASYYLYDYFNDTLIQKFHTFNTAFDDFVLVVNEELDETIDPDKCTLYIVKKHQLLPGQNPSRKLEEADEDTLYETLKTQILQFKLEGNEYFNIYVVDDSDILSHHHKILSNSTEVDAKYRLINYRSLLNGGFNGSEYVNEGEFSIHTLPFYKSMLEDNSRSVLGNSIWVGEFYKDLNDYSPFGGSEENAIELNTFIPISEATSINESCLGLEGDTYFQRWDSLRTYPSEHSKQSIVDAVSIMLETHDNLDGRSDVNRGREDIHNIRPTNIDSYYNEVYSQTNNYITSSVLDTKFDSVHPTAYAWSLTKRALSDIDIWTSINLSSVNKLDGNLGELTKIKRWNNQLLAFQEKGIAIINFNMQAVINSTEGVPIEISNTNKVSGHYYLTTTQGCKNKWSIVESPYGIYFIDSYNKSINVLNDNINSLSTLHLFEDWIRSNEKGNIWKPGVTIDNGFKSFYDPIHKEVYFVNSDTVLCYNELLSQFTSFYDYQNMHSMFNIGNHIYGMRGNEIYKMFEGEDYCKLFDEPKEYSITYKVNKDSFVDKTWTNIEYRADIFNSGNIQNKDADKISKETFDTLEVWNEYQKGTTNLNGDKYPNAKNKFRVWRADIPRDENNKLDRIRNPWIMLKLKKTENTHNRMEFHDLLIKYLQ